MNYPAAGRVAHLTAERDRLLERLGNGWQQVEAAKAADDPSVPRWEDVWIALLGQYTSLCDQLAIYEANQSGYAPDQPELVAA